MTDDLRTRIAAVQRDHRLNSFGANHVQCECGWKSPEKYATWTDHPEHVADAVIRELELHREDMNEWAVLANGFRGHRYVTHWEENEPAPVVRIRSAEKLGLTGDGE